MAKYRRVGKDRKPTSCVVCTVEGRVALGTWWRGGLRLGGGGKEFAPGTWCSVINHDFAI